MDRFSMGIGVGNSYQFAETQSVTSSITHEAQDNNRESRFSPGRIIKFHKAKGLKGGVTQQKTLLGGKQQQQQVGTNTNPSNSAVITTAQNVKNTFNNTVLPAASLSACTNTTTAAAAANSCTRTTPASTDTRHHELESTSITPPAMDNHNLNYSPPWPSQKRNLNPVYSSPDQTQNPSLLISSPQQRSSPAPKKQNFKEDSTVLDQDLTNDDITLTSVRQVVASIERQNQLVYDGKDELIDSPFSYIQHRQQHYPSVDKSNRRSPRIWMNQSRIWLSQTTHHGHEREEKSDMMEADMYLRRDSYYDTDLSHRQRNNHNIIHAAKNTYQRQSPKNLPMPVSSRRNTINIPSNIPLNRQFHSNKRNNSSIQPPDVAYLFHRTGSSNTCNRDDDDRTFDYGVRDDYSQGSGFDIRGVYREQQRPQQQYLKQQQQQYQRFHRQLDANSTAGESSLLLEDSEVKKHRKTPFESSPMMKTAAGVVGCATVGCLAIGPMGLLLGAAAVGIGVGVMQIPEEQRSNMAGKATEAMAGVQESAFATMDALSGSCATKYQDSGIAGHIPYDMDKLCAKRDNKVAGVVNTRVSATRAQDGEYCNDYFHSQSQHGKYDGMLGIGNAGDINSDCSYNGNGDPSTGQGRRAIVVTSNDGTIVEGRGGNRPPLPSSSSAKSLRSKKVACLRHVPIVPVNQIHGLNPSQQSRAWLDVLASADTTYEEKNEAMEEILILAKDKERARIFLVLGILDSIMWLLNLYFAKLKYKQQRPPKSNWIHPEITAEEYSTVKLAATCCVTLGKAHCAAVHTEGDLLLMSLYARGAVPEERQLAQMLYEVPHHARVTPKNGDPTIVDPDVEVFSLKHLTLPQAEDLANSIKALADGFMVNSAGLRIIGGFTGIQPYTNDDDDDDNGTATSNGFLSSYDGAKIKNDGGAMGGAAERMLTKQIEGAL